MHCMRGIIRPSDRALARLLHQGHPRGGPFVYLLILCLAVVACVAAPPPDRLPARLAESAARPITVYQRLGLLSGPPSYPVVGGFATLAGPGDSTLVILALSLPNGALRFRRETTGFLAEYDVDAVFVRDSIPSARVQRRDTVRVPTFAETSRSDESIIFQAVATLAPGRYEVRLRSNDAHSSRGFRATDTLHVPTYGVGAATIAAPLVVYEARGRAARDEPAALIANPRRTAAYGGDRPRIYLEAYAAVPVGTMLYVRDESGELIWRQAVEIAADDGFGFAILDIPGEVLPLGRLRIELVEVNGVTLVSPLVITISDQWIAANLDEVMQVMRYIATIEELEAMASGTPAERRHRWDAFWARRDPIAATPINEFREQFFQRVRFAAENFGEPGRPGWQTDRGEVFIVLGAPDQVRERTAGRSVLGAQATGVEWLYESTAAGRLHLLFVERSGFGRFELVPASRAAFRVAADRLKLRSAREDRDRLP